MVSMADHSAALGASPSPDDHDDLWALPLAEFRRRTAGPTPTPGGGSVASVTAALGAGLVQMAVHISARKAARAGTDPDHSPGHDWDSDARRGRALADALADAAAADVVAFETLMRAYRMPREDAAATRDRDRAVAEAGAAATEVPLRLAETITETVEFAGTVVDQVVDQVRSDVLAGVEILAGAFHAALHTVEINLAGLAAEPRAEFVARRDTALDRLEAVHGRLRPALSHRPAGPQGPR